MKKHLIIPLCVAICLSLWLALDALAAPGAWTAVGSMNVVRENHTLTLLADGQVLAVGGTDFTNTYSSAEIYDPITDSWVSTGTMSTVRQAHSATLLADGRVLVAGGYNGSAQLASAEIYDPSSGLWSGTGSMAQARQSHKAVRLLDGRVLVVSGQGSGGTLATAELYDPGTGLWSSASALSTVKGNFAVARLTDGRVLVAGGFAGGLESRTYQIYTPGTNSWSTEADMNDLRNNPTATLLSDGQVLLAGGENAFPSTNLKTELYTSGSDSWAYTAGDLAIVRNGHAAHLLPNGQVLIVGGFSSSATATAELYTPSTELWSSTGSMVENRANNQSVALADGRILTSGGFNFNTFATLNTAEIYEPSQLNERCGVGTGVETFHTAGETVEVNITSAGNIDCIRVYQVEITHPNATTNMEPGRYWQIEATDTGGAAASGYTLSLVLPHRFGTATDVTACRYPGGLGGSGWDCTVTQTATSTQVTLTGVTQLSDWVVGQSVGPTAVTLQSTTADTPFTSWPALVVLLLLILTGTAVSLVCRR